MFLYFIQYYTWKFGLLIYGFNDIVTNSDSASDYVSIQYENIAVIREILLK